VIRVLALVCLVALAACAPRDRLVPVPAAAAAAAEAARERVLVATARAPDPGPGRFGAGRAEALSFAEYVISIPPVHAPGRIEWPGARPDPARHMLMLAETRHDMAGFARALDAALAARQPGEREVAVFVHGFNQTFAEGLYRTAQLAHDLDLPAVALAYSWPSADNPLNYAYDRDSALAARDGLVRTIRAAAASRAERVVVVAHSMGALLTMEALRQMAIDGRGPARGRIGAVALFSPDIDVDLFRVQARAIVPLPQPFLIFTSRRDRALQLSARLTGQPARLGSLRSAEALADLDVTLIDTTGVGGGDPLNHFTAATSPAMLSVLSNLAAYSQAFNATQAGQQGLLPGTVTLFRNATQVVLNPLGL
jgi:esterase/lipase superfamily enzyme